MPLEKVRAIAITGQEKGSAEKEKGSVREREKGLAPGSSTLLCSLQAAFQVAAVAGEFEEGGADLVFLVGTGSALESRIFLKGHEIGSGE